MQQVPRVQETSVLPLGDASPVGPTNRLQQGSTYWGDEVTDTSPWFLFASLVHPALTNGVTPMCPVKQTKPNQSVIRNGIPDLRPILRWLKQEMKIPPCVIPLVQGP